MCLCLSFLLYWSCRILQHGNKEQQYSNKMPERRRKCVIMQKWGEIRQVCQCTPIILELQRRRREIKANLDYIVGLRTAWTTHLILSQVKMISIFPTHLVTLNLDQLLAAQIQFCLKYRLVKIMYFLKLWRLYCFLHAYFGKVCSSLLDILVSKFSSCPAYVLKFRQSLKSTDIEHITCA